MKSKTSFFNKTVFKKNLTRFAPVMAVYTLCLILGMMMLYQNNEEMGRTFWFASRIAGNLQLMGLVNLLFAPLCAMLLFGDLYNSRMCNALHAMPMRRETLFLTNVVSGLLFSMIPTAVMALLVRAAAERHHCGKRVADRAFMVRRHQPAIHHLLRRGDFQRVLHR